MRVPLSRPLRPTERLPRYFGRRIAALTSILVAGTALVCTAAWPARAARTAHATLSGTLYYSRSAGDVNVRKVTYTYNNGVFSLGTPADIASLPGADGLIFAPDGDLLVGGQGSALYKVDPLTGQYVPADTGTGDSYHVALDPSGNKAWTTGIPGPIVEIPLNPFANGTVHNVTGDDGAVTSLAWDGQGNTFYTSSGSGGGGGFGHINMSTFVTTEVFSALDAAHGMVYDSSTDTLVLFGATHVTQINPHTSQVVSDLDLSGLTNQSQYAGLNFDQGTVDGSGHAFVASNDGNLLFIDYSVSGRIADASSTHTLLFLDTSLDDVAPLFGLGAPHPPAAPLNLQATQLLPTEVDLSWEDRSNNEKHFVVERKTGSGSYAPIATLGVNATSYSDTSVVQNTSYTYRVKATNGAGDSAYTNELAVTTPIPIPAPPSALSVTVVNFTSAHLNWTDNSNNEDGFRIERSVANGPFQQLNVTIPANTTTYTDTGLQPSTTYTYHVKAYNAGGVSAATNDAAVTTPPAAPTGFTAVALSPTSVHLSWTDNAVDEAGYVIERKTGTGAYTSLPTQPANTTAYTDSGLSQGTTYTYRVHAANSNGNSPTTPEVAVTTPFFPKIVVAPATANLGTVKVGSSKSKTIKIKNTGKGPLHVTVGTLAAPFSTSSSGPVTIAPKGTASVTITFHPTAAVSSSATLTITSDDPAKPTVAVNVSGKGK